MLNWSLGLEAKSGVRYGQEDPLFQFVDNQGKESLHPFNMRFSVLNPGESWASWDEKITLSVDIKVIISWGTCPGEVWLEGLYADEIWFLGKWPHSQFCPCPILGLRVPWLLQSHNAGYSRDLRISHVFSIVCPGHFLLSTQSLSPMKQSGVSFICIFLTRIRSEYLSLPSTPLPLLTTPYFFQLATWLFSLLEYTTNLVSDSCFEGLFPGATSRSIHNPSQ